MGSYNFMSKALNLTGHVTAGAFGLIGSAAIYQGLYAGGSSKALIGCLGLAICVEIERNIYSDRKWDKRLEEIKKEFEAEISSLRALNDNRSFFEDLEDKIE